LQPEVKTIRRIRTIKISPDKCIGCRACESICSAFHAEPKYSVVNPKRSRIRVVRDEENDLFVPILAGTQTKAECASRHIIVINEKEYQECSFCRSSCSTRDWFKEPDAPNLVLRCDTCGDPQPEGGPLCVQWCITDALTLEEREENVDEEKEVKQRDLEMGLEALADKYGLKEIIDTVARMKTAKKG
jgi:benzoyl-CoA reductase subunit BamC